jgi:ADP-ribose pyrophosphatase YjhB (NUDIX family)
MNQLPLPPEYPKNESLIKSIPEVAIAIIYNDQQQFLMQLRDNKPNILYPGVWGLFGGHLEAGESPEIGLVRELAEEINYVPVDIEFFAIYADEIAKRYVFSGRLAVDLSELTLNEGWDFGLITMADVRAGSAYSDKAGMVRSLGQRHQKILLDFAKKYWDI